MLIDFEFECNRCLLRVVHCVFVVVEVVVVDTLMVICVVVVVVVIGAHWPFSSFLPTSN